MTLTKGTKGAAHAAIKPKQPRIKDRVMSAIVDMGGYVTRRELHNHTGIEIATLCGALSSLCKEGKLRIAFTTTCDTTGKEVVVYTDQEVE